MITLEELNIKINQLKFSTETAEALLAEILDQLNVFEKNHSQQSNDLQMETLNKIHEQITQIKIKENNSENKEVLLMIESLNNHYENLFNKTHKTQITVFGGNNAALNYGRVLLGCGVIFLFYLGFSFLPSYFLQKQELDENYQTLKIYADFKKM